MSEQKENPYLAHLPPGKRSTSSAVPKGAESEPLFGFLPRKVTANQVRKALEHDMNPFTKAPHTPQYRKILEARKKLPVYTQMDEFFKMVRQPLCSCVISSSGMLTACLQFNANQIIVMVGETGSGKTTQ